MDGASAGSRLVTRRGDRKTGERLEAEKQQTTAPIVSPGATQPKQKRRRERSLLCGGRIENEAECCQETSLRAACLLARQIFPVCRL